MQLEIILKLVLRRRLISEIFYGSSQLGADKIVFRYDIVTYFKYRHRQGTNRKYQDKNKYKDQ